MSGNSKPVQWKKHVPLLGVLLLLFSAGAYVVRVPWFDEVLTLNWLVYPTFEIPFRYTIPNNHIFYTVCLSLWRGMLESFGIYGTLPARILSLLFGCFAIWVISKRLMKAGGIFAALPMILLFAGCGPMILFSTALRGYMPAMLFSFAAFLCAERWMKQRKKRSILFYFIFCYCSVLTIPTNLLSIGAGLLFLLPLGLRSRKEFFRLFSLGGLALTAFFCAYLPIFRKFIRVASIKEGWYSYSDFLWNYYGTLLFVFLPILIFCVIGLFRLPQKNILKWRIISFFGVCFVPLITGLLFQVAPFPRVFFPMIPLLVLIMTYALSGFLRKRRDGWKRVPLLMSVIWLLVMPHIANLASGLMFGESYRDDFLLPYPMTVEFQPQKTAKILAAAYKNGRMVRVFADFDADPPSLEFQLLAHDVPFGIMIQDRPDKGPVKMLYPGDWIVCRDEASFLRLKKRFDLKGNYRILKESSGLYQKIYVPE